MYFQMYFPCLKITTIYPQQFGKLIPQFKLDALKKEEWILIESILLNSLWISVFFFRLRYSLSLRQKVFILLNLITSDYKIETKISYCFQCWVHINHSHFIDLWSLPLHHYIMIIIVFDVVILT